MSLIAFDYSALNDRFYPFTETRDVLDIRIGILTLREKWHLLLKDANQSAFGDVPISIPANIIPTAQLANKILLQRTLDLQDPASVKKIEYPWHIFELNDFCIREDYEVLTRRRISEVIPETV